MTYRTRMSRLVAVMTAVSLGGTVIALWVLYETALEQAGTRLEEVAQSLARLIGLYRTHDPEPEGGADTIRR